MVEATSDGCADVFRILARVVFVGIDMDLVLDLVVFEGAWKALTNVFTVLTFWWAFWPSPSHHRNRRGYLPYVTMRRSGPKPVRRCLR